MRMWMINPTLMCRKHLLGEHAEIHMLCGSIKRNKSINGFIDKKLIDLHEIFERHEDLVREMTNRGYNHKSHFTEVEVEEIKNKINGIFCNPVDLKENYRDLFSRCDDCNKRMNNKGFHLDIDRGIITKGDLIFNITKQFYYPDECPFCGEKFLDGENLKVCTHTKQVVIHNHCFYLLSYELTRLKMKWGISDKKEDNYSNDKNSSL